MLLLFLNWFVGTLTEMTVSLTCLVPSAVVSAHIVVQIKNDLISEIRELGVGYFAFSGKQAERDEQMKRLNQYRKETEKRKVENEIKKQKQQVIVP